MPQKGSTLQAMLTGTYSNSSATLPVEVVEVRQKEAHSPSTRLLLIRACIQSGV